MKNLSFASVVMILAIGLSAQIAEAQGFRSVWGNRINPVATIPQDGTLPSPCGKAIGYQVISDQDDLSTGETPGVAMMPEDQGTEDPTASRRNRDSRINPVPLTPPSPCSKATGYQVISDQDDLSTGEGSTAFRGGSQPQPRRSVFFFWPFR